MTTPWILVTLIAGSAWAARIHGRLYDTTGAAVPRAQVVAQSETGVRATATASEDGSFDLISLTAGSYNLQVMAPGFAVFQRRGIDLQTDTDFSLHPVLRLGEVRESLVVKASGQPKSQSVVPRRIPVGGNVQMLRLIDAPPPVYPERARAEGREGLVMVRAVISIEGAVLSVQRMTGFDADLTDAAEQAVRRWRYQPTLLNGMPVEVITNVEVRFRLE